MKAFFSKNSAACVKILVLVLQSTSLLAKRTCCNVVVVECENTRAVISPTHTSSNPVGLGRKAWKLIVVN